MSINTRDLDMVIELIRRRSGIVLDRTKKYLVEARLNALAGPKFGTLHDIVAKLKLPNPGEVEAAVVSAMTTNETSFFRDRYPFDALRDSILPDLIKKRSSTRTLSLWCAASSTGQEPYTIAMVMREHFPELNSWKINFLATDLSPQVLKRAEAGRFSQLEVDRGLPAAWLTKYFRKTDADWELIPEIRKMITFKELNLLESWPTMPALDVVFIRNVLIYFDNPTKQEILARIAPRLQPDGYLFLGNAETTLNIDDRFQRSTIEKSGCYTFAKPVAKAA